MQADTLIYGLREPKPPFQSWNEPLINKVKTSKGVACACVCPCVCVCEKSRLMNNAWIISFCGNERICSAEKNNSRARVRFDTTNIRRSNVPTKYTICFANFGINVNVIISGQHKNHSNHSKANEGPKLICAHFHQSESR